MADLQEVYARTEAGAAEIKARALELTRAQRNLLIVIDGKPFTWEQVGRMLMTFEGFTLDARVEDTIQVVGDPA